MKKFNGVVEDIFDEKDMMPLADGLVTYADFDLTGVNLNTLVVGSTGCGKTTSITEPMILHNYGSSMVVPVSKSSIVRRYEGALRARGFNTYVIDFMDARKGNVGYDPMDYIHTTEDALELARQIISFNYDSKADSAYWGDTAESLVAAVILLVKTNTESIGRRPRFRDVIHFLNDLRYDSCPNEDLYTLNLMPLFKEAERRMPNNPASRMIRSVDRLPERTAQCVFSTVKAVVDKTMSDLVVDIVSKKERVDFASLGDEKTVIFVVSNPFNESCNRFVNVMYSQMFGCLFEKAESCEDGHLSVPVRVICDDFACTSKIQGFERYVSIFRAAGISVTILLQSESQLSSLYDEHAATTILNNMDTYIYMGCLDNKTVKSVSEKMNLPFDRVMHMNLETVMVMRRGSEPFVGRRYQLFSDPVYKHAIGHGFKHDLSLLNAKVIS